MGSWSFLTNHARTLLCIADDPGARLRDIGARVGVTERRAHDIVTDLVDAGYVVKDRDGRRNRYRIQEDLPLQDPISRQRTIGEMLDLLVGTNEHRRGQTPRVTDES
jgi:predicted transcriptional regulator